MFVIGILITFMPFLLILFAVIAIIKNKESVTKGGEEMFNQLYKYLVMFATLMMSMGGGIGIFMGVADLVSPSPYVETFTEYKSNINIEEGYKKGQKLEISEEQIRKDYTQMIKDETNRTKEEAKNTIIKSFGFIIIPLPIFIFFTRNRKKVIE